MGKMATLVRQQESSFLMSLSWLAQKVSFLQYVGLAHFELEGLERQELSGRPSSSLLSPTNSIFNQYVSLDTIAFSPLDRIYFCQPCFGSILNWILCAEFFPRGPRFLIPSLPNSRAFHHVITFPPEPIICKTIEKSAPNRSKRWIGSIFRFSSFSCQNMERGSWLSGNQNRF